MASLQLSSMWQARTVCKYCLSLRFSHKQQRPWICNMYRSATCNYSKMSGPVRYVPRSIKLPNRPPTQKQDEQTHNDHHDVEGTNKHVLKMPSETHRICEHPTLAELPDLRHDHVKQKGETLARSGFVLEQENDMSTASMKTQYAYESRRNGVRGLQRSSVNSVEICTNMQSIPSTALEFSQQSPHPVESFDSSPHFGKCKEQACTRNGLAYEQVDTVTRFVKTQDEQACARRGLAYEQEDTVTGFAKPHDTAECKDKGARDSQGGSADLVKFSHKQTRESNLYLLRESSVEREAFPQAARTNPSLPVQGNRFQKREPNLKGRKVLLPCQDVESFLLKVQKAKQKGVELPGKSHVTATADGNLCVHNNNDDSHDDECLFVGLETVDENEDVVGVEFKNVVSNSTAAQEHAKNQAIRYLSMRPYTAFQLRKKLENRSIMPELADYALSIVQSCGLQSDLAYAETFSRARFKHGSWGPQRIKLGLKQRGISDEIIQVAMASVFREEGNDSEQDGKVDNCSKSNSLEMSKVAMNHVLVQATKQWNRGGNATHETKIRRMVSWLQYRGFNYSVIKTVLNHLQKKTRIEDEY
eukprot:c22241_g1_i1 orf=32-1792(+)